MHNGISRFRTYHLSSDMNPTSINKLQVDWYYYTAKFLNFNNKLPALTFFHIPLQEYQIAVNMNKSKLIGTYNEKICYQPVNSGLFSALHSINDTIARANVIDVTKLDNTGKVIFGSTVVVEDL